ncbi:MAG: hypothetical protein RLZZ15_2217 [Verrucomicrobiota bacterium]
MDSPPSLSPAEVRVLGALVEKSLTTPEYYPLSLNALANACNQLTNRDPVTTLDDGEISRALDRLRAERLATVYHGSESRVAKHKHTLTDAILLTPAEVALLCVLMLRGPQTVGELRTRSERLFRFDTLPEVEETLAALASRTPHPLAAKLPRAPGTKEPRFAHLLAGPPATPAAPSPPDMFPTSSLASAPTPELTAELAALRGELAALRAEFEAFRRQFG